MRQPGLVQKGKPQLPLHSTYRPVKTSKLLAKLLNPRRNSLAGNFCPTAQQHAEPIHPPLQQWLPFLQRPSTLQGGPSKARGLFPSPPLLADWVVPVHQLFLQPIPSEQLAGLGGKLEGLRMASPLSDWKFESGQRREASITSNFEALDN